MGKIFDTITLKPLIRMEERIETARDDSDESLFNNLLYAAELMAKLVVAGMIAGVQRDVERHQYRHCYKIVRADGIGEWAQELDYLLTGSTALFLLPEIRVEQEELILRTKGETEWQYLAVQAMHKALQIVYPEAEDLPKRTSARAWFSLFAQLRNKSRGHGAVTSTQAQKAAPWLEESIRVFARNFGLFKRPWAYLSRSQSGKYNVTRLNNEALDCQQIRELTTNAGKDISLVDGVYLWLDTYSRVELAWSAPNSPDFFLPNGGFNDSNFETITYFTNERNRIDSAPYQIPIGSLPKSETHGLEELDVIEASFGNLPPRSPLYINRPDLQAELEGTLTSAYRHPIVVLHGRGGIGKTSLALNVLYDIATKEQYEYILWFSARDVDLRPEGPKPVKAHLVSESDVAEEYVRLTQPGLNLRGKKAMEAFESALQGVGSGSPAKPLLLVFDNFETVQSPIGLFKWIDVHLRPPNKVLITTRIYDFKGTYDLEVRGMLDEEADKLVTSEAQRLEIMPLITQDYRKELMSKADGHPYIIKVLLGEVARQGKLVNIERMVVDQENMLTALFERTYASLRPLAKRVFLTACQWRSTIPVLALRAVLLRNTSETIDVQKAVEELTRSSLIEVTRSEADGQDFVTVPLAADVFGRQKMAVEAISSAVQVDVQLLQDFGAGQRTSIKYGISPRIDRFLTQLRRRVQNGEVKLIDSVAMLEFIAQHYPYTWLKLAELYETSDLGDRLSRARAALRRYLQQTVEPQQKAEAWYKLATLAKEDGATSEEIHAWVELASLPGAPYSDVSNAARRVTTLNSEQQHFWDRDEKEVIFLELANVMQERVSEATGTDCSRLAWLYLQNRNHASARDAVDYGLSMDPTNEHLLKLSEQPFYTSQ